MRPIAVVIGACLFAAGCTLVNRQPERAARLAAFLRAAAEGVADSVSRMLEQTPDLLDARDAEGRTALWLACRAGQEQVVRLLVKRGSDVDASDRGGSTPLHAVALFDRSVVVAPLLKEAPPGGPTAVGLVAPLVPNADKQRGAIAGFLIAHGARVNTPNSLGFTPLHIAALTDAAEVARALLEHGADTAAEYPQGTTALGLARACGHRRTADIITDHAARFGAEARWFDPARESSDGKIILVDRPTGIAIDIGARKGARKGLRFDVYSIGADGARVRRGRIVLEDVLTEISKARFEGEGDPTAVLRKGDIIVSPAFSAGTPAVFVADSVFGDASKQALAEALARCGSVLEKTLSRRTDYLVVGPHKGDLFDKARQLGVTIIPAEQLEPYLGR